MQIKHHMGTLWLKCSQTASISPKQSLNLWLTLMIIGSLNSIKAQASPHLLNEDLEVISQREKVRLSAILDRAITESAQTAGRHLRVYQLIYRDLEILVSREARIDTVITMLHTTGEASRKRSRDSHLSTDYKLPPSTRIERVKIRDDIRWVSTRRHFLSLLKAYIDSSELEEKLLPLLSKAQGRYLTTLKTYKKSVSEDHKIKYIRLLSSMDFQRTERLIGDALRATKRANLVEAAVEVAARSRNKKLRAQVRQLKHSPYVNVRRALTKTLTQWGRSVDIQVLRELSLDQSISVRRRAIRELGSYETERSLLKRFALNGPDAFTAEEAARAWSAHASHNAVKIPFTLLKSAFESVRAMGGEMIEGLGARACMPLTPLLLERERPIELNSSLGMILETTRKLWPMCGASIVRQMSLAPPAQRLIALHYIKQWRPANVEGFVLAQLRDPLSELRASAAEVLPMITRPELSKTRLHALLKDSASQVRCNAMKGLAPGSDQPFRSHIFAKIQESIDITHTDQRRSSPHSTRSTPLLSLRPHLDIKCILELIELTRLDESAPLLDRAYRAWRRSIIYTPHRRAVIRAISALRHPMRVSTLMEAMGDLDREVRVLAEEGLRRAYRP